MIDDGDTISRCSIQVVGCNTVRKSKGSTTGCGLAKEEKNKKKWKRNEKKKHKWVNEEKREWKGTRNRPMAYS